MMDSLINSVAAEIFQTEGSEVNPLANMPHHRMVTRAYGYATKPWIGLTDKEYQELHLQMGENYFYQDYGKAIEAKLKEKNQ